MKNGKGVKVTYLPVTHVTPIYPPGYVHPGEAFSAKLERDRKEMLERRAARQRRQAIIDNQPASERRQACPYLRVIK
jgi:hypothetical protein